MTDETRLATLKDLYTKLENMRDIQCVDGNWNYDSYNHGYANAFILATQIVSREIDFINPTRDSKFFELPPFLSAPDEFIADKENREKHDDLHKRFPALKEAWEQYQFIYKMVKDD
jgi:hypothetical protein